MAFSKLNVSTENSKIYDEIYGKFAKQRKYEVSNEYKSRIIDNILSCYVRTNEAYAVRLYVKYHGNLDTAAKISHLPKRVISKQYEQARRHLYDPRCISIAVNGYYSMKSTKGIKLTEDHFGGHKYIISALNKAGIYYKEQLDIHLSNGWYFLWTIPGCGDSARQRILIAIDKWNAENKIVSKSKRSKKA